MVTLPDSPLKTPGWNKCTPALNQVVKFVDDTEGDTFL